MRLVILAAILLMVWQNGFADDVTFQDVRYLETDVERIRMTGDLRADEKLMKVVVKFRDAAVLISGNDLHYQYITVVPYPKITGLTYSEINSGPSKETLEASPLAHPKLSGEKQRWLKIAYRASGQDEAVLLYLSNDEQKAVREAIRQRAGQDIETFVDGMLRPDGVTPDDQIEAIRALGRQITTRSVWLNIDVLRVKSLLGVTDATRVHPDGTVYHRDKLDPRTVAGAAWTQAPQALFGGSRVLTRGSRITVKEVRMGRDHIRLDITGEGGADAALRLEFGAGGLTLEGFNKALGTAFSETRPEEVQTPGKVTQPVKTVQIDLGMAIEDVVKLRGQPKTRINLGAKTILTYEDVKFIFLDDKLVDAQ